MYEYIYLKDLPEGEEISYQHHYGEEGHHQEKIGSTGQKQKPDPRPIGLTTGTKALLSRKVPAPGVRPESESINNLIPR
jgi:hypothetical protein